MTKVFILISVFNIINLCMGFHQNTYHIVHRNIVITSYNNSAVHQPLADFRAYNSTASFVISVSGIIMKPYKKIMLNLKSEKLVRQVYRPLPGNLSIDICDELENNRLGTKEVIEHANLKSCPLTPGSYYLKDYILEEDKFPPHAPLGKYRLYLEVYVDDVVFLANATWQGEIVKKRTS